MVRQVKKEVIAMQRAELAIIIRAGAEGINRPNLKAIMPDDIGRIRMLPMNRIYCVACGVPLYVNDTKGTIQIADPMPVSSSDCKHLNRGVPKRLDGR